VSLVIIIGLGMMFTGLFLAVYCALFKERDRHERAERVIKLDRDHFKKEADLATQRGEAKRERLLRALEDIRLLKADKPKPVLPRSPAG
jgi:hypothetical protein